MDVAGAAGRSGMGANLLRQVFPPQRHLLPFVRVADQGTDGLFRPSSRGLKLLQSGLILVVVWIQRHRLAKVLLGLGILLELQQDGSVQMPVGGIASILLNGPLGRQHGRQILLPLIFLAGFQVGGGLGLQGKTGPEKGHKPEQYCCLPRTLPTATCRIETIAGDGGLQLVILAFHNDTRAPFTRTH